MNGIFHENYECKERLNDSGNNLRKLEKTESNCYRDFSFARCYVIRLAAFLPFIQHM